MFCVISFHFILFNSILFNFILFFLYFYGRCPEGIGRHNVKMSYMSFYMSVMSHFLGLWLVKNILVIEVEVDELHEGKILSRPSTSMTISPVAQEYKKNNESLSWAVPHWEINQTKNCPLLQYNRGHIMRQGGHMLQQELKEIKRGWTELCHTLNQTKNNKKFTYSGHICRFAQFFVLHP